MSPVYLDTSALLKRYVAEVGSGWVNALLADTAIPLFCISQLAVVEATCAFARRLRDGTLSPRMHAQVLLAFDYDCQCRYTLLDVVPVTIETACILANKHPLRAYDAMHLATAWLLSQELLRAGGQPLTFVSADDILLGIAHVEGLQAENPNHHP
jgi:hypothetical protein